MMTVAKGTLENSSRDRFDIKARVKSFILNGEELSAEENKK